MFLTATDVQKDNSLSILNSLLEVLGLNQQGLIAFVAGEKGSNGLSKGNIVAGTDFAEGFVVAVGA